MFLFSMHATRLHTRLTELLLLFVACFILLFYVCKYSVWWRLLKWNVRCFSFSRILMCLYCCLCIVYTVLVVIFAYLYIPFFLMLVVVVSVAIVYRLMLNDITYDIIYVTKCYKNLIQFSFLTNTTQSAFSQDQQWIDFFRYS